MLRHVIATTPEFLIKPVAELTLEQQNKIIDSKFPNYRETKARRTRRGKRSAKWHECHFAQENSRRVRMIFAEEILICLAEENIYHV